MKPPVARAWCHRSQGDGQSRGHLPSQKSFFPPKFTLETSLPQLARGPCTLRSCNLLHFLENEENIFGVALVGLGRVSAHHQLQQRGENIPTTSCSAQEGESVPQVCHVGPILLNMSPVGPTPAPSLLLTPWLA